MDFMYMASPTTPIARKAPAATPTPSKSSATTSSQKRKTKVQSESSPTPGQKRKAKNESVTPKNGTPKGKGAGARSQPGKKQKVVHEETGGQQYSLFHNHPQQSLHTLYSAANNLSPPHSGLPQQQQQYMAHAVEYNSPNGHHGSLPTLEATDYSQRADSPQPSPPAIAQSPLLTIPVVNPPMATPIANIGVHTFDILVNLMFTRSPGMLPQNDTELIKSSHLDILAYKLWDWLLTSNLQLHKYANHYGAMLAEPKLRILASLNILPSWWFLRSRVLKWLQDRDWTVDDSVMQAQIDEIVPKVQQIMVSQEEQRRRDMLARQAQNNQQGPQGQQGMGNEGCD